MSPPLLVAFGHPVTALGAALAGGVAAILLLLALVVLLLRSRRDLRDEAAAQAERAREVDDKLAELTGRMQTMVEVFGSRQGDFARMLAERIDQGGQRQAEHLSRLNERLAVIDAAQRKLSDLTGEVVGLKDVLANKQARGAYGQGRMEAIVRDGLPVGAFAFQATLSNRTRPDCLVRLPGDPRGLVIDAKFPLESFSALRAAQGDEARGKAAARVRSDLGVHIRDIAEKYLIPGETQEVALLFVPAESIYADLQEHFDDVVQRAHRARVVIVSPSLLAMAIQVLQALVRDARIRDEARVIQTEVGRMLEDVERLRERVGKLDAHFRQAEADLSGIRTVADRIATRGRRIDALEFDEPAPDLFGGRVSAAE
ncbi:MAG TPA: DNA recombination protein RmuC [Salinarimonas sp.]|nr:DNA recombination protein RmuC [Salinarimonas sp.]